MPKTELDPKVEFVVGVFPKILAEVVVVVVFPNKEPLDCPNVADPPKTLLPPKGLALAAPNVDCPKMLCVVFGGSKTDCVVVVEVFPNILL